MPSPDRCHFGRLPSIRHAANRGLLPLQVQRHHELSGTGSTPRIDDASRWRHHICDIPDWRRRTVRFPPIIFREIAHQWADLRPGIVELFTDDGSRPGSHLSDKPEHWLVAWLVSDAGARHLLCEVLERPHTAFLRARVQSPFYTAREGDIDLLICGSSAPHETAVIECKR